ncbi:MAG: hypothetical protein IT352_15500 [Gemmatimonadales bacterium]|nr:hypothetical protein [Gemmatimonadales bacterium]
MTAELGRINAADNADSGNLGVEGLRAILVTNALAAPIYGRWSTTDAAPTPSETEWDLAIPGEAYMVIPVPDDVRTLRLKVDYPGAVPGDDVQAVIVGTECSWSPFVGPLA